MSEAFITRRGGSGGLPLNNAVLHINAPTGSTITLKKGNVTVKVLAAGKGHTNIDGVTADWYYSISSANYGSWTITATKDSETATEILAVNAAKQYDVRLSYNLYIVKNGVAQTGYTITYTDMPTHTLQDGILYLNPGTYGGKMAVGPLPSVSNRTKAVFEFEKIENVGTDRCYAAVGEGTSYNYSVRTLLTNSAVPVAVNVNISSVAVSGYYAKVCMDGGTVYVPEKVWLKNIYLAR